MSTPIQLVCDDDYEPHVPTAPKRRQLSMGVNVTVHVDQDIETKVQPMSDGRIQIHLYDTNTVGPNVTMFWDGPKLTELLNQLTEAFRAAQR